MRTHLTCSIALALLAGPAVAQEFLFVPASAATADSNTKFPVAGFDRNARQQIIIHASHLTGGIGRDLIGMAFRRDAGWSKPLDGGQSAISVVLSPARRPPEQAAAVFDANLDPSPQNRITVFSGFVTIPASGDATSRVVSWSDPQDVVELRFATPYRYLGGDLCVDLTGATVTGAESAFWAVDAAIDGVRGAAASIGVPCGGLGAAPFFDADVAERGLVPGSTARFRGYGHAGSAGAAFLGVPMPAFDLSLLGLSNPGCDLLVNPFTTIPVPFVALTGNDPLGCARLSLEIPGVESSLGFGFRLQFLSLAGGVETTNALDCVVASAMPTLGMATVFAPAGSGPSPVQGEVRTNRSPVLRFEYR